MLPGTQSQRISAEAEEVRHPAWRSASPQHSQGHMYSDALYSFTIGFVGAILFLLVDKYQPVGPLARLLKFSDPVRRWRGNPAQVAALRSRAVLAEILL